MKGDAEIADQVAGVAWLVSRGLADPNRVGIMGWSYGGGGWGGRGTYTPISNNICVLITYPIYDFRLQNFFSLGKMFYLLDLTTCDLVPGYDSQSG